MEQRGLCRFGCAGGSGAQATIPHQAGAATLDNQESLNQRLSEIVAGVFTRLIDFNHFLPRRVGPLLLVPATRGFTSKQCKDVDFLQGKDYLVALL